MRAKGKARQVKGEGLQMPGREDLRGVNVLWRHLFVACLEL